MTDATLQETIDFHTDMLERVEEDFEGDMPVESIATIVRRAAEFETIMSRFIVKTQDEEQESPPMDALCTALEEQAVDMLAGLAALQFEYDLDIPQMFAQRRDTVEAIRNAETMEDLHEAVENSDAQLEILDPLGVGDNVDMEGYEPEDRGRDVY